MVLEKNLSLEDYFDLEKNLEVRHEFVDGELIQMPGTTFPHNDIVNNISYALLKIARAKGCRLQTESIKLQVTSSRVRYPDIMISCQPKQNKYLEFAPCFLAEILSETSEIIDYGAKVREYLELPSLETYAIIAQTQPLLIVYQRDSSGWRYQNFTQGALEIPCLETSLT